MERKIRLEILFFSLSMASARQRSLGRHVISTTGIKIGRKITECERNFSKSIAGFFVFFFVFFLLLTFQIDWLPSGSIVYLHARFSMTIVSTAFYSRVDTTLYSSRQYFIQQ